MLDINFDNLHIPMWWILTGIIGFIICWISLIAGCYLLLSKSYKQSTFVISIIGIVVVLGFAFLGEFYPDNFGTLFLALFMFSLDMAVVTVLLISADNILSLGDYSIYICYVLATVLKFLAIFGFVGFIQKITGKVNNRVTKIS
jgi:hypothetical protein